MRDSGRAQVRLDPRLREEVRARAWELLRVRDGDEDRVLWTPAAFAASTACLPCASSVSALFLAALKKSVMNSSSFAPDTCSAFGISFV